MEKQKYTYDYPRAAVTTDCVVFGFDGHDLNILLIQRGQDPYKGAWAFPGGFLNMGETAEQGALRELKEETGLDVRYLKQVGAFSDVDRDPRSRVITIAFYALAKKSFVQGNDDAAKAQWFALNEVPRLAFDHDLILRKALQKLREDIHFEPIGFDLLDKDFTIPELQHKDAGLTTNNTMRILILNGPNLNLLGKREPKIYGTVSFETYLTQLRERFPEHEIAYFQSNHEGVLIDKLQEADGQFDAVVMNPGAYAHTSIALADCIRSISIPVIEVHISDIAKREPYRRHSYTAEACLKFISGLGLEGYAKAIESVIQP